MKADVRDRWAEVLRGGNYCQGTGYLRVFDYNNQRFEYCCWGVLCEMSGLGKWVLERYDLHANVDVYSYLGETQYPPLAVTQWAGVDGSHAEGQPVCNFVDMNDDGEHSFPVIASVLDGGT